MTTPFRVVTSIADLSNLSARFSRAFTLAVMAASATVRTAEPGHQGFDRESHERLIDEIYAAYIALYFYAAQANYWAQGYLPAVEDFDERNQFHALAKSTVDVSDVDFRNVGGRLVQFDQDRLARSPVVHLLTAIRDSWAPHVRSVAQVFAERQRARG